MRLQESAHLLVHRQDAKLAGIISATETVTEHREGALQQPGAIWGPHPGTTQRDKHTQIFQAAIQFQDSDSSRLILTTQVPGVPESLRDPSV